MGLLVYEGKIKFLQLYLSRNCTFTMFTYQFIIFYEKSLERILNGSFSTLDLKLTKLIFSDSACFIPFEYISLPRYIHHSKSAFSDAC